ncbi:MAG: DUF4338 domain-containing protein [Deltaproteobacteria bacterium]|nr:DUF4338 domain-containing protein [Deltaproteobacteria bacterium]
MAPRNLEKFCGQTVSPQQLAEIVEIIETFPKLSRTELANTICEIFSWKRPNGKLKSVECRQFLERLEDKGTIKLPACREQFATKSPTKIQFTPKGDIQPAIDTQLKELLPIHLTRVDNKAQRQLWYEYIDRYHYLGYRLPFGAQLRYFIQSGRSGQILGCFQFSSPAWKMAPRDRWIGWSDAKRKANLQKIINNSRFLILPWVHVKNLASTALSLAVKRVPDDWQNAYGYRAVLMETLVDQKRFKGTCYKAANWIHVGKTTGRGRMDRAHARDGTAIKEIYLYPLSSRFRQELTGS